MPIPESTLEDPVSKILCIWKAAEGTTPDGVNSRGFAGQILFFSAQQDQALQVNGTVRVYLFDDNAPPERRHLPIHQFDFEPEAWQTHLRATVVGASYDVFVPFPNDDGRRRSCSIRVRLIPPGGTPAFSELTQITLPGSTPRTSRNKMNADQPVTSSAQPQPLASELIAQRSVLAPESAVTVHDQIQRVETTRNGELAEGSVPNTESPHSEFQAPPASPKRFSLRSVKQAN